MPRVKDLNAISRAQFSTGFRDYIQLAKWVGENVSDTVTVAARKPQLFHIYSGTYTSSYKRTLDHEELLSHLDSKDVDYVVVDQLGYSSTKRNLVPAIQKHQYKFKEKVKLGNPSTYLFEFVPEIGYSGSFDASGKRNGFGTFIWDNKIKYEGNWKDNKRDGRGKLIYTNGDVLYGVWIEDKLNGQAQVFNVNGELIKNLFFEDDQIVGSNRNSN